MLIKNFGSWFFVSKFHPGLGCLLLIIMGSLLVFWFLLQVFLFPVALPAILFIFWPLSHYLYQRRELDWLQWGLIYMSTALILGITLVLFIGTDKKYAYLLFCFAVQSFGMGAFMYGSLYNAENTVAIKKTP